MSMIAIENNYLQYSSLDLVVEFKNIFNSCGVSRSNIGRFIKNHY